MGTRYLCSRTELFRLLDIDIGTKPLFIGSPPSFLEWLSRIIPGNAVTLGTISSIPSTSTFDRVIIWKDQHFEDLVKDIGTLQGHLDEEATIWLISPLGSGQVDEGKIFRSIGEPFPLSTDHQIRRISVVKI